MDNETYDQLNVRPAVARRRRRTTWSRRPTAILQMYDDEIVGVELPAAVELNVAETEPGIQGDRVSGARKPATLETGLVVQVPLFVNPATASRSTPAPASTSPGREPLRRRRRSGDADRRPGSRREAARARARPALRGRDRRARRPGAVAGRRCPLEPDAFAVELVQGVGRAPATELDELHRPLRPQLGARAHAGRRPRPAAAGHLRAGAPARRAHRRGDLRGRRAGQALLHRRLRPLRQRRALRRRRRGPPAAAEPPPPPPGVASGADGTIGAECRAGARAWPAAMVTS